MNDNELVAVVANQLQITELEVFKMAYSRWHRSPCNEKALESIYGQFIMNRIECPHWVRDYCKRVVEALQENDLQAYWELSHVEYK